VEFILGNLLPVAIPALLMRMHGFTFGMWVFLRIFVSITEHSGYAFPWDPSRLLPFGATVEGHDFHHSHNTGVFASQFTWWDRVTGTDLPFLRHRAELAAAAAKLGPGPAAGAGSDADDGDVPPPPSSRTRARAKAGGAGGDKKRA
jgi:sterol desaturase/sphingolipid hydroxylase (fatty acid hydroxylase superfamily)